MRIATIEEIAALEMLVDELKKDKTRREVERELRAVERELATAVTVVSAAPAPLDRREVFEAGHATPLSVDQARQRCDIGHERVEDRLEALTVASLHWQWGVSAKGAHAREARRVPGAGSVL